MTIIQHYYTSVEGKGFQTSEIDGNLDYELIKEIERGGNYSPPRNLPSNPSSDELDLFPISFSFYKKDGKYVITHSKYIGKEYTGRYGNYFAHSLIFDTTSDIFNLSPIQLWNAEFWVSIDGSEIQQIPKIFPELKISSIKSFYSQRKEQISLFLVALNQFLQTKKRIIIVDSAENVANMIYLASLFIPTSIFMEKISFTTYTINPNLTNYSICGTTKDSDFYFSSDDYREYNIFNFFEEKYPTQLNYNDFSVLFKLIDMNNMKYFEAYFNQFLKIFNDIPVEPDLLMIHDISCATIAKVPKEIKDRVISNIQTNKFTFNESTKRSILKKKNYEIYEQIFYFDIKRATDRTKNFLEYSYLLVNNSPSNTSQKFIDRAYEKIWDDENLEFEEIKRLLKDKIIYENIGGQCKEKIVDSLLDYHHENEDKETYDLLKKIKNKPHLITPEKLNEIEYCISRYDSRKNRSRELLLDDSAQGRISHKSESNWDTIHYVIVFLLSLIICLEIIYIYLNKIPISQIPEIIKFHFGL